MVFAFSIERQSVGARKAGAWVSRAYKSGMAWNKCGHVTHVDMRASRCMCSSSSRSENRVRRHRCSSVSTNLALKVQQR